MIIAATILTIVTIALMAPKQQPAKARVKVRR